MESILIKTDSSVKHVFVELQRSLVIAVDTRELQPWTQYFQHPTQATNLATGDYSIIGLTHDLAIERKSLNDLVGCFGPSRKRFEQELDRSQTLKKFWIIVEADYEDLVKGRYRSELSTNSAIESIAALSARYNTNFLFAHNPPMAARLAESLLVKWFREKCKAIESVAKAAQGIGGVA